MEYVSRQRVDRYLSGDFRPRRALRLFLQDALVAVLLRLQSVFGFVSTERAWASQGVRIRWRRMMAGYELRRQREHHDHHLFERPTG